MSASALALPALRAGRQSGKLSDVLRLATRHRDPLVDGLRRQDPEALRALYDEYGRTTFGYLLRALRDRGAAEDVQQQVFLEVWQRGAGYDERRGGLLTWIMTIARSRAIDHLRRRVPEPRDPQLEREAAERGEGGTTTLDELLEEWRVAHLLRRLPPEEADLLRRRFYEDQSQREIAEATGIPLGTVKLRMVQGLGRLRGLVEAEGGAA